jgi:hypothetical protein
MITPDKSLSNPFIFKTTIIIPIVIIIRIRKVKTTGVSEIPHGFPFNKFIAIKINPGRRTDRSRTCTGFVICPASMIEVGVVLFRIAGMISDSQRK